MQDIRVKKNMSREHVRNSSRQNKASMSSASNFLPELNDNTSRDDARSPIGSPKKLNIQTKIRGQNGALRINVSDNAQGSSISEMES